MNNDYLKSFIKKVNIFSVLEYSTFLMAFFLPLSIKLSNVFLILFFVGSAYLFFIKKEYSTGKINLLFYSTVLLFITYVLGLLVTEEPVRGLKTLERGLSFILCPLIVFFHSKENILLIKRKLFHGLTFGSVLSLIILLSNNFYSYFITRPLFNFDDEIFSYYHTYYYFTKLLDLHPTYLGAYVILSIVIVINWIVKEKRKLKNWIYLLILFILSLGVLFINSRIIFMLYGLIIIGIFTWILFKFIKQKRYVQMFVLVLIIAGCIGFVNSNISKTFIYQRITKELSWELSEQVDTKYNSKISADSRIARWKSAFKVFKENPLFGHGNLSEKDALSEQYKKDGLYGSLNKRYDAHNIYLSFAIEFGVFGLLILLYFLFTNLYFSLKFRDLEYFMFFCMICMIGIFESYLKNNAAITFVAFFGSVFLFSNQQNEISEK
ncbi:O-antigen ligase family protein [Candidatus Marifrigoribacter sp. Uisw_064]|jgi:O-antigen ligase|uniref:O-antigen ligase family protein n=1 Tax=Candidatus Marifrigoribacter sp. Uisw_064 TaxID=3230970 RepID=UPI003D415F94